MPTLQPERVLPPFVIEPLPFERGREYLSRRLENRKNNFDLIRFVLSLAVVLTHSYCVLPGAMGEEPLMVLTGGQVATATIAVDGFFLVSGLLVASSWERSRSAASFLIKRALRVYPAFVLAVVLTVAVCGVFTANAKTYYTSIPNAQMAANCQFKGIQSRQA